MKRLENLTNLTRYLADLHIPDSDVEPIRVVDENQATTRLAKRSGMQILIALPEVKQEGTADSYVTEYSTAIFVLDKVLGAASTPEREDCQFFDLVEVACTILTQIERDVANFACETLRGLDLINIELFPVSSIFGGWNGYSIVLGFK